MSANDMRKLMEAVDESELLSESEISWDAINELEDLNEQLKDAISQFETILRQAVGYDDILYNRFKSYPGGHIMSSLGTGGYGDRDTTLDEIIQDMYQRNEGNREDDIDEAVETDDIKRIANACEAVWSQIAFDIMEEEVTSAELVELTTDADRLASSGYEEEQKLFRELASDNGYSGALRAVAAALPYQYWEAGGSQAL